MAGSASFDVVIPAHNTPAGMLDRAVASAAGAASIIVVDDGSASPIDRGDAIVIRHETARGPAAARNAGIARTSAEWVVLLDDDDELLPAGVRERIELATALDAVAACGPRVEVVEGDERVRSMPGDWPSDRLPGWWACFRPVTIFGCSGWVIRRDAAIAHAMDESLWIGEDRDFFAKLASAGTVAVGATLAARCTIRSDGNLTSAAHLGRRVRDHAVLVRRWIAPESEADLRAATMWLGNQCSKAGVDRETWSVLQALCVEHGWRLPMKSRVRRAMRRGSP